MRRLSLSRIAIFLFIVFATIFADETDSTSAVTFPIKVDWLKDRYAPVDIFASKGINMVSPDYVSQNNHLWKVKYQGTTQETYVDSAGQYIYFTYKMDDKDFYLPYAITLDEYFRMKRYRNMHDAITKMAIENTQEEKTQSSGKKLELIGADIAGQRVALRVSGNINISGQMNNRQRSTVATNIQDGKSTDFKIDQKMRFNIEGTIGDRVSILVDQDSERSFDFENNMRIIYTGKEDEIIQSVSAGNISLSLPGTKFVTFSSKNSGLFGIKSEMKFGAINLTAIASVEKGEKQKISYDGGSDKQEKYIEDWNYERNKYFYLDEGFRNTFWEGYKEKGVLTINDRVVKDLEVYKSVITVSSNTIRGGAAYIDPEHPDDSDYEAFTEKTDFERLELDKDYTYNANLGFITMKKRPSEDEVLAVAYRVVDYFNQEKTNEEYGDWDFDLADTTNQEGIVLKLIKPRNLLSSTNPCWDLMWRNVYYLGATQIDSSGFDVQIVFDGESGYEERDKSDGKTYLEKFNLDLRDASNNPGQDDIIDGRPVVNLYTGELWFPFLEPFRRDETGENGGNPNLSEEKSCELMYENSRINKQSQIKSDMKYRIKVNYENRSSIISLGPMVMEGSEEITLNGQRLVKGTGYLIDYMSGILTLLDESAMNPDAKLDVKYEKNSFFQLKKKTILGARAQYDFGEDKKNFIGATGLYYSKSVVDDKVDVGYEPMANFVFDINGKYSKDLTFMTKAIDRLPLISTDKQSSFTFEGEIAQVLPNPNTINNDKTGDKNGVAYVDDFEGSKRTTSPVLTKNYWSRSAVPVEKEEATTTLTQDGKTMTWNELAGHTFWYIDYTGIDITDVWPDKDVGRRTSDRTVSPLYLNVEPEAATSVGMNATNEAKKQAWGGVTYFFPTTSQDQSETKYIDLWIHTYNAPAVMHIDLGTISEDQVPDGKLNTEDDKDFPNNIYDKGEDTGLDGLNDEDEFIFVRDYNSSTYTTLLPGDAQLENYRRINLDDPHLDNFDYSAGDTEWKKVRTTNGTEANKNDGSAGGRPDTENKNTNPDLDDVNNYVSITIPLNDLENKYIESQTRFENGNLTGWKLYRIPLSDFEMDPTFDANAFSWEQVEAMRIWLDGIELPESTSRPYATVAFAKIEMVRNEWRSMGVDYSMKTAKTDRSVSFLSNNIDEDEPLDEVNIFGVEVKNTEEDEDYYPPSGVEGEYDKINEVQTKEQSLVLKLYGVEDGAAGIGPMGIATAEKDLLEELSMINYKRLKMFINGYNIHARHHGTYVDGEKTPLIYFLRFGKGGATPQYYEIRQPVYGGWDKRNEVNVDIDFMTSLKKYNTEEEYTQKNNVGVQEFWIFQDADWGEIRQYKEVKDGEYTGKEIIIYGTPAISRIMRMETGIFNNSDNYVQGEVWLDEMRLSEVRKNAGVASRAAFAINFADLAAFNVNIDRKDADFHRVEEQPSANTSSLNDTKSIATNASLSLHKFFPTKWGLNLPVTASATQSESKPKYLPGTDILAGDNPPDSIITINQSYAINTSYSKKTSDFWLTKYTIDQLQVKFHAGLTENSDRQTKMNRSVKYSGGVNYGIPFGRNNFVQLFKWAENVPFFGPRYAETKFYYTPEKLTMSADFAENKNDKDPRLGESTSNHTMGMDHSYNLGYKLTDNIKATYARKMKNNMNEIVDEKWENFKRLKFGSNESVTEAYNFSFSPQIFSWLNPQMTYSSNYTYSDPITDTYASIQTLSNSNTANVSASLNIADIFKSFYSKSDPKKGGASSRNSRQGAPSRSRGRTQQAAAPTDSKDKKASGDHPFLDGVHGVLSKVQAIQVQYSVNNSINSRAREVGNPTFAYRLGFTQDPGLDTIATEGGYDNPSTKTTMSLRSGLNLTKNISTTFSYANDQSSTISQNVESRNTSQDYFPLGKDGKGGFPFPSWNVRISGLEKLPLIDKWFTSLSASHAFSGKESITFKDTVETNASYRMGFSPLISMNMKFKNKMSSDFRITTSRTITNSLTGISISDQNGASLNLSYKHQGGITIPIPFMEKKRLDNNLDFTFSAEYSASSTKQKTNALPKFTTTDERSSISLKPRIGYSFTSKVTGGVFFQYQIIDDKRIGERKNMNYGFDVNIAIQG